MSDRVTQNQSDDLLGKVSSRRMSGLNTTIHVRQCQWNEGPSNVLTREEVGMEMGILDQVVIVKPCTSVNLCECEPEVARYTPLLKNLFCPRFPTMMRVPRPPFWSFAALAARQFSRQCRSTASSAGMRAWLMNFSVKRLSSPLCISRSHDVGVAFVSPSASKHISDFGEHSTHDA